MNVVKTLIVFRNSIYNVNRAHYYASNLTIDWFHFSHNSKRHFAYFFSSLLIDSVDIQRTFGYILKHAHCNRTFAVAIKPIH